MKIRNLPPKIGAGAAYLLCCMLVPVYVNMFPIWKYLSTSIGEDVFIYLPTLILFLFLTFIFSFRLKAGERTAPVNRTAVFMGIILCCLGLLATDPEFPVKRIHVAEYAFLCLVARYAMSHFIQALPLLFFSAGFSAILGIHDEFLQGLHPARTFGLQDMGVNLLGSFGGGLIWHGLQLFSKQKKSGITILDVCFICWLLVSVLMLIWPAQQYRGLMVESWVALPILATGVYFCLYHDKFTKELSHGITALTMAVVSLCLYPLLTRLSWVVFY